MPSAEKMFMESVAVAAKMPGVRINREKYLRATLSRAYAAEQMEEVVANGIAAAGINAETIAAAARAAIKFKAAKVPVLSAAAGMPGGRR